MNTGNTLPTVVQEPLCQLRHAGRRTLRPTLCPILRKHDDLPPPTSPSSRTVRRTTIQSHVCAGVHTRTRNTSHSMRARYSHACRALPLPSHTVTVRHASTRNLESRPRAGRRSPSPHPSSSRCERSGPPRSCAATTTPLQPRLAHLSPTPPHATPETMPPGRPNTDPEAPHSRMTQRSQTPVASRLAACAEGKSCTGTHQLDTAAKHRSSTPHTPPTRPPQPGKAEPAHPNPPPTQTPPWHLADIPPAQTNVRYGGKSGHDANGPLCRLMTQSGHRCLTETEEPEPPRFPSVVGEICAVRTVKWDFPTSSRTRGIRQDR